MVTKKIYLQEDKGDAGDNRNGQSPKQVKQSEARIMKLIEDGETLVTNVKVAGETKEVTRRQEEDEAQKAKYDGRVPQLPQPHH